MAMTNEMIAEMVKKCAPASMPKLAVPGGVLAFGPMSDGLVSYKPDAVIYDMKQQMIDVLMRENAALQGHIRTLMEGNAAPKTDPLIDQVDNVIKGMLGGKVPAKKVDELGDAVTRSRSDRAVIRNINRG